MPCSKKRRIIISIFGGLKAAHPKWNREKLESKAYATYVKRILKKRR